MTGSFRFSTAAILLALALNLALLPAATPENVPDLSGEYQFLASQDTLGILEEEGKLKGYVDVSQGEDESDAVLSYQIVSGARQGGRVEFKTSKIHEKYYRFTGVVQRGSGKAQADPDFLRLVGDLEIVTADAETGQERTERRHVTFKWKGKPENGESR